MKRVSKVILIGLLLGSGVDALEFGGMGNISASMGGAGVALRNSQWALYYNPALLGMDKKSRIAYSFGVSVKEKNLLSLATVDYENLQKMPNRVGGIFGGGAIQASNVAGAAVTSKPLDMSGIFGDVLKNVNFGSVSGLTSTVDVQNFMENILSASGGTQTQIDTVKNATSLNDAANAFKNALMPGGNLNDQGANAFDKLKGSILEAVDKTGGDTGIFKNIIQNVQPDQLGGLAELLAKTDKNSISLGDLLITIGALPYLKAMILR